MGVAGSNPAVGAIAAKREVWMAYPFYTWTNTYLPPLLNFYGIEVSVG